MKQQGHSRQFSGVSFFGQLWLHKATAKITNCNRFVGKKLGSFLRLKPTKMPVLGHYEDILPLRHKNINLMNRNNSCTNVHKFAEIFPSIWSVLQIG